MFVEEMHVTSVVSMAAGGDCRLGRCLSSLLLTRYVIFYCSNMLQNCDLSPSIRGSCRARPPIRENAPQWDRGDPRPLRTTPHMKPSQYRFLICLSIDVI